MGILNVGFDYPFCLSYICAQACSASLKRFLDLSANKYYYYYFQNLLRSIEESIDIAVTALWRTGLELRQRS